MKIEADPEIVAVPGSFGEVEKSDNRLHMPPALFSAIRSLGARTAESLYDQANASPTYVAKLLGWTPHDVQDAVAALRAALARAHPEFLELEGAEPPEYGYGAMPPRNT